MKKFENKRYNETYFLEKLENGLTVILMPKNDYIMSYGMLTVKYGALDCEFSIPSFSKDYQLPLGIAHFLEHKMFEKANDLDINEAFASIGADVNAYTTYTQTGYYFSTTRNFEKALEYLLDLVGSVGYSDKTIKEEMPIIEQELLMYLDDPNVRLGLEANKTMYQDNLVREDIGGTTSSIKQIDKKLLDLCYQLFYHPSNMILTLVGNFDLLRTIELIKENLQKINYHSPLLVSRKQYHESLKVCCSFREILMDVVMPKVSVNLKLGYQELSSYELIKLDYAISMLMHQNFDITSDFYCKAEAEGIINNSFDFDVSIEKDYRHITITTDTPSPEVFIKAIKSRLLKIKEEDVILEEFERYKKIACAQIIRKLNSIEYLGNVLTESQIYGLEFFEYLDIINKLTIEDVKKARTYFVEEAISVVIIKK